ncbi:hypothetical protein MsAg5_16560 [Methanosarcinaceae archaeon Ag5]|uniref:Uncharacterized protein n=1 Tax=Methanolapillus africanus TaxID=3028297 RepID=A0AAE4SEL1_9EURY|nr:hypothetical protein [Methanosarcinaceae archaeon Ag5]
MNNKNIILIILFLCAILIVAFAFVYPSLKSTENEANNLNSTNGNGAHNSNETNDSNITTITKVGNESGPFVMVGAQADTPNYSLENLGQLSDLIVFGTLIEIKPAAWSTPDGEEPAGVTRSSGVFEDGTPYQMISIKLKPDEMIYTDLIFEIEDTYKGNETSGKVAIRVIGGEYSDISFPNPSESVDLRQFKEGDKYIVCLVNDRGPLKDIEPKHYSLREKLPLQDDGTFFYKNKNVTIEDVKNAIP